MKKVRNLMGVGSVLIIRGIASDGIMKAGVAFGIMFLFWGFFELAASKEAEDAKREEMPKRTSHLRRYNRRKWKEELFYLKMALLGGAMSLGSLFIELVPDKWVLLLKPMFIPGLAVFVISLVGFFEARDSKDKKNTRKRRGYQ